MALQARRDTRNGSRRDDKHAPAGPNTIMPTTRPAASKARPPSALRRTQTTSADPRRTSGTEGLSPKLPSNLDIRPSSRTRLTSVIFSEPLLLCQSRKRRENWKCHQRG
jgi:hypothetical protein